MFAPGLIYFPLVLWALGYLEFISQVLFRAEHGTELLGWSVVVAGLIALAGVRAAAPALGLGLRELRFKTSFARLIFFGLFCLGLVLLLLAGAESRLPPHLMQEYDTLNYHYSIPKQHLLAGTLAHLSWSAADLWPMPIQWGFTPAWFLGGLPNRVPQWICLVWLLGLMIAIAHEQEPGWRAWIPALALLTSHGVGVQLGTGMMDLPNLYFLIGAIHAFTRKRWFWAAIHTGLVIAAKGFSPVQSVLVMSLAGGIFALLGPLSLRALVVKFRAWILLSLLFSAVFLARSVEVDLGRAGTPLFPFATCSMTATTQGGCEGHAGQMIRESARLQLATRDSYGLGRGPLAWVKHLYRVSVPTQGVNNEYDYPLGLSWLLLLGLMLYTLLQKWISRSGIPFLLWLALSYWATWWMGSQQSRWLYPVLALGWLATLEAQRRVRPVVLVGALLLGGVLTLVSVTHAIGRDLLRTPVAIVSEQKLRIKTQAGSGLIESLDTLYYDTVITHHGRGDPYWVLQ